MSKRSRRRRSVPELTVADLVNEEADAKLRKQLKKQSEAPLQKVVKSKKRKAKAQR